MGLDRQGHVLQAAYVQAASDRSRGAHRTTCEPTDAGPRRPVDDLPQEWYALRRFIWKHCHLEPGSIHHYIDLEDWRHPSDEANAQREQKRRSDRRRRGDGGGDDDDDDGEGVGMARTCPVYTHAHTHTHAHMFIPTPMVTHTHTPTHMQNMHMATACTCACTGESEDDEGAPSAHARRRGPPPITRGFREPLYAWCRREGLQLPLLHGEEWAAHLPEGTTFHDQLRVRHVYGLEWHDSREACACCSAATLSWLLVEAAPVLVQVSK